MLAINTLVNWPLLCTYSRTPVTQTLKGNEKQFELVRVRVIGVDYQIQFAILIHCIRSR